MMYICLLVWFTVRCLTETHSTTPAASYEQKSVRLGWPPKCGEVARDLKITSESSTCGCKAKNKNWS